MALGKSNEILERSQFLREGETEISERAFNLLIGGMLLYGLLINYGMVALMGRELAYAVAGMNPLVFLLVYFGLVIAGNVLISKPSPVLSFVGYNLIVVPIGLVLCVTLQGYAVESIKTAVLMTAIITLSFMIAATVFPSFFLKMGRVLLFGLLALIIGELVALLLHSTTMAFEWLGAGLFSLYIGYDWARANTCARTVDNAIDLSASMYLDIINLFLRILSIVGRRKD